ncbi:hypothetical protein BC829DRAFT_386479 [Chytridium lagenaria]|nr:hypothetical protein BC829DRAFT_386479 [Chytridium lagenaria]
MSTRSGSPPRTHSPTPSASSTSSSSTGLRFQQALLLQKQQVEQEDERDERQKIFGPFVETVDAHYAVSKKLHDPLERSLSRSLAAINLDTPNLAKPGSTGLFPLSNTTTHTSDIPTSPSSHHPSPKLQGQRHHHVLDAVVAGTCGEATAGGDGHGKIRFSQPRE